MPKTKELKTGPRDKDHVAFGSRLPCERLSFQRDLRPGTGVQQRVSGGRVVRARPSRLTVEQLVLRTGEG